MERRSFFGERCLRLLRNPQMICAMGNTILRLLLIGFVVLFVMGQRLDASPDAAAPGDVAAEFINAYVAVSMQPGGGNTTDFVQSNAVVTERFKRALDKLYSDALKVDPEMGYGADAVIGGQDCPERFRVKSSTVKGDRARVVLIGEDPDFPMEVKVVLVREDGRWLIDASGDLVKD